MLIYSTRIRKGIDQSRIQVNSRSIHSTCCHLTRDEDKTNPRIKYPPSYWDQRPKNEPLPTNHIGIALWASLAMIIVYAFIRKGHEVDENIQRAIDEPFGHEAAQLLEAYHYNLKHNKPTYEIRRRLRELGVGSND